MQRFRWAASVLVFALAGVPAWAAAPTRSQALAAVERQDLQVRLAGLERLAEIGVMDDTERLRPHLSDADPRIREATEAAILQIWSRSGDAAIDALYARGIAQMRASALDAALATFDDIVRRKPAFAEGWNKRATVHFLLGHHEQSLRDCDEVFKRNPRHFGALSGAGQIHLQLGHLKDALTFFRLAVQANPNLDSTVDAIRALEEQLRDEDAHTT